MLFVLLFSITLYNLILARVRNRAHVSNCVLPPSLSLKLTLYSNLFIDIKGYYNDLYSSLKSDVRSPANSINPRVQMLANLYLLPVWMSDSFFPAILHNYM